MTSFQDGPAKGQHLMLKRAPVFLRVVESRGTWDALDQLEDTPRPDERIFAYQLTARPGGCHINRGGGGGGFYTVATYRLTPVGPTEDIMRDSQAWAQWCNEHGPAVAAELQ